jgi:GT2 family glycosyltransferase
MQKTICNSWEIGKSGSKPRVIILVLNWNNYLNTYKCIKSLLSIRYPHLKICLIDNASSDKSSERISECFKDIHFLQSQLNGGYAFGNNIGLSYGLEAGADYFLILNNDTEIKNPSFISEIIHFMEDESDVGVVGPLIRNSNGTFQRSISYFPLFVKSLIYGYLHIPISLKDGKYVDSVDGMCLIIRRRVLEDAGLLDINYFMYGEEQEWQYRIRKKGWKVVYLPVESVIHHGGMSAKRISDKVYTLQRSNVIYTLVKHNYLIDAALTVISYTFLHIIRLIVGRSKSKPGLPSLNDFLRSLYDKWVLATKCKT